MRPLCLAAIIACLGCSTMLEYDLKRPADGETDTATDPDAADMPETDTPDGGDAPDDTEEDTSCEGLALRVQTVLTPSTYGAYGPDLVWTGTEYGLTWYDGRGGFNEVIFARIDNVGDKIGSDVIVSNVGTTSVNPSLVYADSNYGIAWQDGSPPSNIIWFVRLDHSGLRIGDPTEVADASSGAMWPDLAWSGSEYLVAWHDNRDGDDYLIYYAMLEADGTRAGGESRLPDSGVESVDASVVWAGSQFAVAWEDRRSTIEIYAARVDASGSKVGSDVLVSSSGAPILPTIAWSGSEIAVAFQTYWSGVSEMAMRRMDGSGTVIGSSQVELTSASASAEHADLVWAGSTYALAWNDDRDTGDQIYLGLADPADAGFVLDTRVTEESTGARYPALAWTGSEIGVAWADNTSGESVLNFAILSPCP